MRRRVLTIAAGVLCSLAAAMPAAGDGGPPQGAVQGWDGLANGAVRYVAVPVGDWTSVQVINRSGGRVVQFLGIKGRWGIPLVAVDSPGDALLRDGRTLVLAQVSYGRALRKHSSFVFADMKRMRIMRRIQVSGHMTFDAISPDARYMYLTEYVSPQDFTAYRVRAFDLKANRLLPKIVSDRTTWETTMQGWPVSRVNRDGWAFTLYATGGRPFIHALDTRHVAAVCINLPWASEPRYIYDYRVRFDRDGHLVVRGRHGRALVTVDRESLRVLSSVRHP
jgi:hypothetical protein